MQTCLADGRKKQSNQKVKSSSGNMNSMQEEPLTSGAAWMGVNAWINLCEIRRT